MLAASRGYGPVAGVLLIAAAAVSVDPWMGSAVPLAAILPACDGDVVSQDGQFFYEGARLAPQETAWATSAWLERANHNAFNELLPGDPFGNPGRPECASLLAAEAQQGWLVEYAADFLTLLFGQDSQAMVAAGARLGLDTTTPAPDVLYGLPARVAVLAPTADRRVIFRPAAAEELATNLLGGDVTTDGVVTHFCPKGFYSPATLPGSEPCHRNTVTIPGQPSHAVVSWAEQGAALRFALPQSAGDLSGYEALSLRAAVDPLSALNADMAFQPFTVRLTDGRGNNARVATRPDEPALQFPPGLWQDDPALGSGFFTSPVPLTTIRLPLGAFAGVDLTDIREIALEFDQTPRGALFMADVEALSMVSRR